MLLSEIRIAVGIPVWAQLPIGKVRSSPHYRNVSRTDCGACKTTDILKEKEVAGNHRYDLRSSKIARTPQQTRI